MKIGEDDGVTLTVATDLYPEVTLGQYKGLEVEKAEANVTSDEIDAEIDRMAQNVARITTVDRAAQDGDTALRALRTAFPSRAARARSMSCDSALIPSSPALRSRSSAWLPVTRRRST